MFMEGGDVDVWSSWEGKDVQWGGEDVDVWWSCEGEMSIGHGSRCSVVMAMSNGRAQSRMVAVVNCSPLHMVTSRRVRMVQAAMGTVRLKPEKIYFIANFY